MRSTTRQESTQNMNLLSTLTSLPPPPAPHIRKTKIRIWTNHRNGQIVFTIRGIPRFRGRISCAWSYGRRRDVHL